ncbi:GntR family transcriptional regulator [Streptomyces cacaoi]|uniref:GntR family transcriptional regulator n=1 Tax=Streptomyces cacaoi TaxID=1898 RepID=UPI00374A5D96
MPTTEVRERIPSGEFGEGLALPPERHPAEQTGPSRATVREAWRFGRDVPSTDVFNSSANTATWWRS